jgi:hypothetical protein
MLPIAVDTKGTQDAKDASIEPFSSQSWDTVSGSSYGTMRNA